MWKVHEFSDLPVLSTMKMSFFGNKIYVIARFFSVSLGVLSLQRSSKTSVVIDAMPQLRPAQAVHSPA